MTEALLALVPTYGAWLLALTCFASCLALPLPASMLLLAAGGFAAAGDLSLPVSYAAALGGAAIGDQAMYAAGRRGGEGLVTRLRGRGGPMAKAVGLLDRRGGIAVFLSRWLISALAPYVSLAAGAARLDWLRFTLAGLPGAAIWVGLYMGAGYVFTGNLEAASALALKALGFVAAGAVTLGLGWWLFRASRSPVRPESAPAPGA